MRRKMKIMNNVVVNVDINDEIFEESDKINILLIMHINCDVKVYVMICDVTYFSMTCDRKFYVATFLKLHSLFILHM